MDILAGECGVIEVEMIFKNVCHGVYLSGIELTEIPRGT
jgi:hypothetical protein